jgi:hypothetical protein
MGSNIQNTVSSTGGQALLLAILEAIVLAAE